MPVHLRAQYRSHAVSAVVDVVDLSRHGLLLRGEKLHDAMGTPVAVVVDLLEGPVNLAGEIVRIDGAGTDPGLGIRFTGLDEQVRRELANYMIERHYQAHA